MSAMFIACDIFYTKLFYFYFLRRTNCFLDTSKSLALRGRKFCSSTVPFPDHKTPTPNRVAEGSRLTPQTPYHTSSIWRTEILLFLPIHGSSVSVSKGQHTTLVDIGIVVDIFRHVTASTLRSVAYF